MAHVLQWAGLAALCIGLAWAVGCFLAWRRVYRLYRHYNPIYNPPWEWIAEGWKWVALGWIGIAAAWIGLLLMHIRL